MERRAQLLPRERDLNAIRMEAPGWRAAEGGRCRTPSRYTQKAEGWRPLRAMR